MKYTIRNTKKNSIKKGICLFSAALCLSAFAVPAFAEKIPYSVDYGDRSERAVHIEGEAESGKFYVLQVLKYGKNFDYAPQPEDVLYRDQAEAADGKYSFDFTFGAAETEGIHYAVLVSDDGRERTPITLALLSASGLAPLCGQLNSAAEQGGRKFYDFINENKSLFGFDFVLTEDRTLEDELDGYLKYVKANPITTDNSTRHGRVFKSIVTAYSLNKGELENIHDYVSELNLTEGELADYKAIATGAEIQKYFTAKMSKKDISTIEDFDNAVKEALLLTGVRYSDGGDQLRSVLSSYGSAAGINYSSGSSIKGIAGNDYTTSTLAEAFKNANQSIDKPQSGNKGGGGGFGGSSYTIEPTVRDEKPSLTTASFEDIDGVEWASEAILALADKNIINGAEPRKFLPNDEITREELVKILVGAMNLGDAGYSENAFADVPNDAWYCSYVNIARENGIARGIGGGMFGVGQTLTREDMATMIYNALRLRGAELGVKKLDFDDKAEISDYAVEAVSALSTIGAVNGVSETEFQPKGGATRAQAAKIIYGVLGYLQ